MSPHICKHCEQPFKLNRGKQKYCSRVCYAAARIGNTHNFKGSGIEAGYRWIRLNGRRIREHRHLMEQHLGRPLLPFPLEVVHHKDGNPLNNAIDNLELKASQSAHAAGHHKGFRDADKKQCLQCLEIKPRTEFRPGQRNRPRGDPNDTYCRDCRRRYDREKKRQEYYRKKH